MKEEFDHIFDILKNGNQEEVKAAKKRIDKLWHSNSESFKKHTPIALEQLREFDTIRNLKNKEAFISGLSLFFLVLSDEHFKELKDFVLKIICHPNGDVREQMRKTADWMYMSLSSRIHPFVWPRGKKLTQKQIVEQEKAKKEYREYLNEIEILMEKHYDRSYNRIKYIQSLKPSVYKSLQLLWSDLTRGSAYKNLHTPSYEIISRRKEIEKELSAILKKLDSKLTVEEIKDIIYDETEMNDLYNIIKMFKIMSVCDLDNLTQIINDAWNYFPHKILNGLCPAEIASKNKQEKLSN